MATPELDKQAKEFKAKPDSSILYIYRNEFIGSAVRMDVVVDNELLGETKGGHFMWVELPPGNHEVMSRAERNATVNVKTEPGKIYYVWQEATMGVWYARTDIHQVDEQTGKKGVLECKLVQHRKLPVASTKVETGPK